VRTSPLYNTAFFSQFGLGDGVGVVWSLAQSVERKQPWRTSRYTYACMRLDLATIAIAGLSTNLFDSSSKESTVAGKPAFTAYQLMHAHNRVGLQPATEFC